jgi:DNA polymerase I-like protein with 3'-5' exonuclease and polymerase domains
MDSLPSWKGAKRVAVDTETCDPKLRELGCGVRRGGRIVGISVAIEDGPAHYLPFGHEGGDNLSKEAVLGYMREQGRAFDGDTIVGMNLQYDLDYLWENDIFFPQAKWYRDVMIADPIINELHRYYNLDEISKRWGLAGKQEGALRAAANAAGIDPKGDLHRLPARFVGEYAIADVTDPLKILRKQERKIVDDELQNVFDLESRVLPVLVRMRRRGIRVDTNRLHKIEEWTIKEETIALEEVKRLTGVSIELNEVMNARLLSRALDEAGIEYPNTAAGNPSVKTPALEKLQGNKVAEAIVRARRMNKIRTTFAASVRKHLCNGRIHGTLNQVKRTDDYDQDKGAAWGRLSGQDPNMQNQPGRDEETGPMWRSIYVPDDDGLWATNDYSQQEPRWSFHFGDILNLEGAHEICEIFRKNPDADCYTPLAELAGISRSIAKIIWLGRCYGMGGGKMCKYHLNLPTQMVTWDRQNNCRVAVDSERGQEITRYGNPMIWEDAGPEGQAIIDKSDAGFPFLKALAKVAKERALERGYVTTFSGRRCHFPRKSYNSEYQFTHAALNRIIQGSAGDQTKTAMVALDDAGFPLQLQVHDEIDQTVEKPEHAEEAAKIMRECVTMRVPVRVDVELGPSWGESMKIGKPERPYVWSL